MAKIIIKKNVANQKLHYTCKQHDLFSHARRHSARTVLFFLLSFEPKNQNKKQHFQ